MRHIIAMQTTGFTSTYVLAMSILGLQVTASRARYAACFIAAAENSQSRHQAFRIHLATTSQHTHSD
jgi:hypothetical protein